MKVLVTGSRGFLGRNLCCQLSVATSCKVLEFNKGDSYELLQRLIEESDVIFHLAGVNRPSKQEEYITGNELLTKFICDHLNKLRSDSNKTLVFASSKHALSGTAYGVSKKVAESHCLELARKTGHRVFIVRLPNVFGKWSKPNYNSVVATFCHNLVSGIPLDINKDNPLLSLTYVDDVVKAFIALLKSGGDGIFQTVAPTYDVTIRDLAFRLKELWDARAEHRLISPFDDFSRALYSTLLSFIPIENSLTSLIKHTDQRGFFCEILHMGFSGQISAFTIAPGQVRGEHFHNSKNEKFVFLKGELNFVFEHVLTKERHIAEISESNLVVIETFPGWAHSIENIGSEIAIGIVWANEVFDRKMPDTYAYKLG